MENDNEILRQISKKLSILVALQLENERGIEVKENVAKLTRFGLSTSEIAEILGTTSGTVAVAKSRIKGKKK